MPQSPLSDIIRKARGELLKDWVGQQISSPGMRPDLIKEDELRVQSADFLERFSSALESGGPENLKAPAWAPVLEGLAELSRERGRMGFTPSETAQFVFSLKQPLFARLRAEIRDPAQLLDTTLAATAVLDELGLRTTEFHQQAREELIRRQQEEMLELSTPVVKMWDGIVALPLIGTSTALAPAW